MIVDNSEQFADVEAVKRAWDSCIAESSKSTLREDNTRANRVSGEGAEGAVQNRVPDMAQMITVFSQYV
ncbi:hypothetical protein HC762_01580 [bacterium]|nr:hypothetical protein [bacterium]